MGITFKCGANMFHVSYRSWNNFRITMLEACLKYINSKNELLNMYDYNDLSNIILLTDKTLSFLIKNIEYLNKLNIIGIYHLLINDKCYVYNNIKKILDMINIVENYINDCQKDDLNSYKDFFIQSVENKKNIYSL